MAIWQDAEAFRFASDTLQNTREFVLYAIYRNGLVLQHVKEEFRKDPEIVQFAIAQNDKASPFSLIEQ